MASVNIPHLKQRGGRWWTHYAHPLIRRPNGKLQIISVSTGLRLDQISDAMRWSEALSTFKNVQSWQHSVRYKEALALHEGAAKSFFEPIAPPLIHDPFQMKSPTEDAEREAERLRWEIERSEYEAELLTLKKELGKTLAGKDLEFAKLADQYVEWGKMKGGKQGAPWSFHHIRKRIEHFTFWKSKFKKLSDVKLVRVEDIQRELLDKEKSGKTVGMITETIAAFCEWALTRKYFLSHPLKGMGRLDSTPVTTRRAMTPREIQELLAKCAPERVIVYETALISGLRRNELQSIVVGDLDQERGGLILRKDWTKNKKDGFQPLPSWLVEKLAAGNEGRGPNEPLLPTMPKDTYRPLEKDLAAANIPKDIPGKGKVDFHSLRTTFLTLVDGEGASPKSSQAMGRHSTPDITFRRYVKAVDSELVRLADAVGEVVRKRA